MNKTNVCDCGARHAGQEYFFPYWENEVKRGCSCGRVRQEILGAAGSAVHSGNGSLKRRDLPGQAPGENPKDS